jgi:uncharacterized iron-regulated protein
MKQRTLQTLCTLSILIFFVVLGCGRSNAHIYRVADGTTPDLERVIEDLLQSQVILIGETHDNPAHHRAQLQIINALWEKGAAVAIGLEMFRSDYQEALDQWVAGHFSQQEFREIFHQNWVYWDMYSEIFHYAKSHNIPLVGLNLERDITSQVARGGFASLSKEQLRKLPVAVCNVDPVYEQFIRRALGMHASDIEFKNFCEAQLLWDMVMAEDIVRFLQENPGYTVVVLAGQGHSWKHGIPAQIQKLSDYTYRVLLPEESGRTDQQNTTEADADYLLLSVEQAPLH